MLFAKFAGGLLFATLTQYSLMVFGEEQCDYMDLGEDTSSHNYTEYGYVSSGAYACLNGSIINTVTYSGSADYDETIRIGNCANSYGAIEMTLQTGEFLGISVSVQTGTDASTAVFIDGELKYQITNLSSSDCTYYKFALDTDSLGETFQLVINDTILYNNETNQVCYGDLQIAYVETIAISDSCEAFQEDEEPCDYMDLGEDTSSHSYTEYGYVSSGAYACLADGSIVNTVTYTGDETYDETIRIGNCANSYGAIEMTMKTADLLGIYVSVQTGTDASTAVLIDGEVVYQITDLSSSDCTYYEIDLDTDSLGDTFQLVINDSILYNEDTDEQCYGDLQIAYVETKSASGEGCVTDEEDDYCDFIDLGEDTSSHNYSEYGYVSDGAYGCLPDGSIVNTVTYTGNESRIDQTIRIGNCANSYGAIEMTMITADYLGIYVSTQTGGDGSTAVYIDGKLYYQITDLSSSDCTYYKIPLDTDTLGDTFDLVINDTILYNDDTNEACFGDLQIAYVETTSFDDDECITEREQCDYMDLGEDTTSHNYTEYGYVSDGAYACLNGSIINTVTYSGSADYDETTRIGNCAHAYGAIEMTLQTGEILGILVSTQTGTDASTAVYIDGELYYQITDLSSSECTYYSIALDTDSLGDTFDLVINDTILYNNGTDEPCYGDLQIAYVETKSTQCDAASGDDDDDDDNDDDDDMTTTPTTTTDDSISVTDDDSDSSSSSAGNMQYKNEFTFTLSLTFVAFVYAFVI